LPSPLSLPPFSVSKSGCGGAVSASASNRRLLCTSGELRVNGRGCTGLDLPSQ
jgi:hypothetical protein